MYLENGGRPPTDMVMPQGPQTIFSIFVHIPFFIFLFIAGRAILRDSNTIPFLFLLGGLIFIVFEPIVDVLDFCYFPSEGQWVGLAFFDRDIPFFMYAVYSRFVGGEAFLFYTYFQEGRMTKSGLWSLYGVPIFVSAALELPGLLMGVYMYYGYQPFQVLGFPLWWPALNPIMPIMAGFWHIVCTLTFPDWVMWSSYSWSLWLMESRMAALRGPFG